MLGPDLASKLEHRRWELDLTQRQVADLMGVNYWTFITWEKGREPLPWAYPAIIKFLGYEPWDAPTTLGEQLKAERLRRGLTIKAAAKVSDVDEGTFLHWERDEWRPQRRCQERVCGFLSRTQYVDDVVNVLEAELVCD